MNSTIIVKKLPLDFDPRLVEESVLRAIETRSPEERVRFRRERNPIYQISDLELRETRFRQMHGEWFGRLGLADPIVRLLREQPLLSPGAGLCIVLLARDAKEESADLYRSESSSEVESGIQPTIVIRLRPATLLDEEHLCLLLRHELGHVVDMLDPEFGYDPSLALSDAGAWFDNLVRARYHVVWDARIDGRLSAAGYLSQEAEEIRCREFAATFPMLGPDLEAAFHYFFDSPNLTHNQLLDFARNPNGIHATMSG